MRTVVTHSPPRWPTTTREIPFATRIPGNCGIAKEKRWKDDNLPRRGSTQRPSKLMGRSQFLFHGDCFITAPLPLSAERTQQTGTSTVRPQPRGRATSAKQTSVRTDLADSLPIHVHLMILISTSWSPRFDFPSLKKISKSSMEGNPSSCFTWTFICFSIFPAMNLTM